MNNLTKWTGRISWSNPYRGRPMPYGRPLAPLSLSPAEREQLVALTRSRSMPHALVTRAKMVLLAADGVSNTLIAERLRLSKPTVGQWRQRYLRQRVQGLYDELRPGGPRAIRDEQIARLLRRTLKTTPRGGTHWSCRHARRRSPPVEIHRRSSTTMGPTSTPRCAAGSPDIRATTSTSRRPTRPGSIRSSAG